MARLGSTAVPRWATALAVCASVLAACGHAPVTAEPAPPEPARDDRVPVMVTGSRIPQWVDPTSTLPATTGPVVIHPRERIVATGHPEDIGAALQQLDPSVHVEHH